MPHVFKSLTRRSKCSEIVINKAAEHERANDIVQLYSVALPVKRCDGTVGGVGVGFWLEVGRTCCFRVGALERVKKTGAPKAVVTLQLGQPKRECHST